MRSRHVTPLALALLSVLLVAPVRAGDEGGPKPLADRLRETHVTLEVEEMPFAGFVDLLRMQSGINILIDPRIRYDIEAIPVTDMVMTDVDLHTVLDLLARTGGESVTWTIQDDVVLVTMRDFVPARLDVRIYPVAELVAPRAAFVPEPAGLLGQPRVRGRREAAPALRRCGRADRARPGRGAALVLGGDRGRGHPDPGCGAAGREGDAGRAPVRPRVPRAAGERGPRRAARRGARRGRDAGSRCSIRASALSDRAAAALLAGSAAAPAICLAVRDGVSSTAFAGTRRAYVAAYEPRFAGETTALDPRVDAQELGLAVAVRAVTGGGDGRILLKLGVALARAVGGKASHAAESPGIDLPTVVRMQRESTLLLTPGRWHLAEGRTGGTDAGPTAFLVRVTPLDPEPAGPPAATPFLVPTVAPHGAPTSLAGIQIAQLQWEEVDLDQVVAYLRTISGLDFYIAPRVRAQVYDEIEISLHLADVSLQTVLDLVTEPYELVWSRQGDLVVIDRRGQRGPEMTQRYFDVKDLTEGIVQGARGGNARHATDRDPAPVPLYEAGALVELVRETIGRYDVWEDPASIEARNGILIARNEVHVLDDGRPAPGRTADRGRHGGHHRGPGGGGGGGPPARSTRTAAGRCSWSRPSSRRSKPPSRRARRGAWAANGSSPSRARARRGPPAKRSATSRTTTC